MEPDLRAELVSSLSDSYLTEKECVMIERWVVVNTVTMFIVRGPFLWDGVGIFPLKENEHLMLEADALAAGYIQPED